MSCYVNGWRDVGYVAANRIVPLVWVIVDAMWRGVALIDKRLVVAGLCLLPLCRCRRPHALGLISVRLLRRHKRT
ncbi:hypothetical protein ACEE86_07440, partial [Proteus mirabilis]